MSYTEEDVDEITVPKHLWDKLMELEAALNEVCLDRKVEVHTAILAILSGQNHLQLGLPGTGKTFLPEQLSKRIDGLNDEAWFKWTMNKFTQPEELFGGPDFKLLRSEEGIYKRVTYRKLPRAFIAFLDETYNGSSSILNTLLTIMNEGEFYNHDDDPKVPLLTLFGASNQGPQSGDLAALDDRFMFRHLVEPLRDVSSFMTMITSTPDPNPKKIISIEEIHEIRAIVATVELPDDVLKTFWEMRESLQGKDIYVSDRRYHQAVSVVQAEAFMNGRLMAEVVDTKPLQHCMWKEPGQQQNDVRKVVLDLADPLEKEAQDLHKDINDLYEEFTHAVKDTNNKSKKVEVAVEVWGKMKSVNKEIVKLRKREREIGRKCASLNKLRKRKSEICVSLLRDGMGIAEDKIAQRMRDMDEDLDAA